MWELLRDRQDIFWQGVAFIYVVSLPFFFMFFRKKEKKDPEYWEHKKIIVLTVLSSALPVVGSFLIFYIVKFLIWALSFPVTLVCEIK